MLEIERPWTVATAEETWHERVIDLRRSSDHAKDETRLAHELFQQAKLLASRGDFAEARAALNECL